MADASSRAIVLRAPNGEAGWTLIELQGALESRAGATASLDGVEFGTLVQQVCARLFCDHDATPPCVLTHVACASAQPGEPPKLVMGKTELEGELVKLKKPLAIMSLVKPEGGHSEYHAAGIVRQKYVFKTRPVPVNVKLAQQPVPQPGAAAAAVTARQDRGLTLGTEDYSEGGDAV